MDVALCEKEYELRLWDTSGQEGFNGSLSKLRALTYPGTDVCLVLFSVVNHESLNNVAQKVNFFGILFNQFFLR